MCVERIIFGVYKLQCWLRRLQVWVCVIDTLFSKWRLSPRLISNAASRGRKTNFSSFVSAASRPTERLNDEKMGGGEESISKSKQSF